LHRTDFDGTPALDDMMTELLRSVRKALGMEVAFVSEFTGDVRVFRFVDADPGFMPLSVGLSGPLDESYCKLVCEGALSRIVRNAQDEAAVAHIAATRALPVGAHLSVPIRFSDGRLYGTFCCFSRSADPTLNERDLAVMNTFADFATRMLERTYLAEAARARARTKLARITRDDLFEIHYQPLFEVAGGALVGHEALARFPRDPDAPAPAADGGGRGEGGAVADRLPDAWFREASQAGMLESFELAVLRKALAGLPRLPAPTYLSMNVSPETILAGHVDALFTGLPVDRCVLEVTEHASVTDYPLIAERLSRLRAAGLRLAVDDAGAGFASFRHILSLAPDIIKLDASLIQRIDVDRGRRALAAALIRFAEEIGSRVVAEGVETAGELQVLRELKVDEAQGFLLGRPAPLEAEPG
jgi:EAL domain-containing protein (putative c-di-GMP-specific phosphodiesterase class I)